MSGTISLTLAKTYTDHGDCTLIAEAYMDTVSAIRGSVGRPAMKPGYRFVFMSKTITVSTGGKTIATDPLKFNFLLENTGTHPLIDAYVGVEFSVVYKVTVRINVQGRLVEGKAEFYCSVPGCGVDPAIGKRYVPQDFNITPDGIAAGVKPGTKVPKFHFFGQISSTNCCFNEPFEGYLIAKESEL